MKTISLIEFGDARTAGIIEPEIQSLFGMSVMSHSAPMPPLKTRGLQASGEGLLLETSHIRRREQMDYALGITSEDLFVPGMNFVFGMASESTGCAVISIHRLRSVDEHLYRSRVVKEAVHELGHILGLGHCDSSECVMHFSNILSDTDRKLAGFCDRCVLPTEQANRSEIAGRVEE